MFFTGDIAQPLSSVKLPDNPPNGGIWVGNLEGSLIDANSEYGKGVYNNLEAIRDLCSRIPFRAFGIANNHLLDSASVETTLTNAKRLDVPSCGSGNSLKEAQKSIIINDNDGTSYRVLAFGWENIQCIPATYRRQGVNPYTKSNVLECVKEELQYNEPVVCFMHWDYELERYPQPYDRELAMDLIDMGVFAVIGCHAHRVQPVEFYKGRPIAYGLGNFLFYQGHYFDGKLRFPKFCEEEYVFEIKDGGNKFALHHFHYDSEQNKLEFVKSEDISADKNFEGKAEFTGFKAKEYEEWFKIHRVQKKLLPIFKSHETNASYFVKSIWIKVRGKMINLLTKANIKSANRANRQ